MPQTFVSQKVCGFYRGGKASRRLSLLTQHKKGEGGNQEAGARARRRGQGGVSGELRIRALAPSPPRCQEEEEEKEEEEDEEEVY